VEGHARKSFENTHRAPTQARRFASERLNAWGLTGVSERILLALSELTTNAVTHGSGSIDVTMHATAERLRVMVTDGGGGTPAKRLPETTNRTGGWGLHLVDTLTDQWGSERDDHRLVVWFEHRLPSS
jgi:anti-sigma regulatory factor (Ser/Thr protein kinase)